MEKRQGDVAAGDEQGGKRDMARVGVHQRFDHLLGVDGAKDAIEPHRRDDDDGEAEHDADAVPADLLVAEHRRPMQRVEHWVAAVLWPWLHRSIVSRFRELPHPNHIVVAASDFQCRVAPSAGRADGRQTTSKTRAGGRGLALRQVRPRVNRCPPSAKPSGLLIRSCPRLARKPERPWQPTAGARVSKSEDIMDDSRLPPEQTLARRTILKAASLGLGAGLASALAAQAQTTGTGAAQPSEGAIWSAEYWAKKGDVALNLWRKRIGTPKPGETPLPVLFLVHGSSNSARSSYDLTVPGKGEYSLMNVFPRYGYDVWTMDHDGYGYSGSSGNNSDIASGVEDLKAAIPVVARETGRAKMHFYGTSSGSIRAAAFAQAE